MTDNKTISIIIPTKNEERNIERCLKSIRDSTYKNVEVIVVDQASTDNTQEISKKYGAHVISVEVTDNRWSPPSKSRNIGFRKATGDYIYHLDADMALEPELLSDIVNIFTDQEIVAIVVPEFDVPENIWAKAKAFERSMYLNTDMEGSRVSRRKIFEKFKYDETIISGEDWNIHDNFLTEGRIGRTKSGVKHYIGSISLQKEFKKKLHYGMASNTYVSKKSGSIIKKLLFLINIYLRNVFPGFFTSPKVVFAFLILRTVDITALVIGLIAAKIRL